MILVNLAIHSELELLKAQRTIREFIENYPYECQSAILDLKIKILETLKEENIEEPQEYFLKKLKDYLYQISC